ncbi:LysR family transcriptional regulator [Oceanirhabdus sp. W0125-5]|uniref:LysR family transcriptional regulator n=1 Tax=Oceanirhabdus sp. W0125-5 TaxID=2999116 RepID=UPI0022F2D316|nr:LysR family transcriptional regulator [Oceanirhabdus sp. W0125-5]WBW96029.1 LysR family transcriptional regulator [Oceanirhabdus sp. W0125-5]
MNIESIETFVLLAKTGNFTKTAEMQYVVQSTISNRINELERYVGKELFYRNNRNVELTDAGKAFLPYAKRILVFKKDGIIKARSTGKYEDRLSIGVVDSIYKGILSSVIKEYFNKFSNIAVKLKVNDSEEIIRLLGEEILDVGFIYTNPKLNKFKVIDYYEDEIILVTSNKNNTHIKKEITSSDLLEVPLLYADLGSEFFKWLSEVIGDSPLLKLSVDRISYVVDFVKEGFGYAFVTKSFVEKELFNKELIKINLKNLNPPSKKVYMVVNESKMNSIAIKNWVAMLNDRLR